MLPGGKVIQVESRRGEGISGLWVGLHMGRTIKRRQNA